MDDSKNDSFVFYRTYFNSLKALDNNDDRWELIRCYCQYAFDGEIYVSKKAYVNSIFEAHRFNIDRSIERRKISKENGSKGGAPTGNQNAKKKTDITKNNQKQPNNNLNWNVNGNEDDNENVNSNEYVNEKEDGYLYVYKDEKRNELPKKKRKGGTRVRNLRTSDLESLFPNEDINCLSEYYTRLMNNDFVSEMTGTEISTVEKMQKDYEESKRK